METKYVNGMEWIVEPTEDAMLERYNGLVKRNPDIIFKLELLGGFGVKQRTTENGCNTLTHIYESGRGVPKTKVSHYMEVRRAKLCSTVSNSNMSTPAILINALYKNDKGQGMIPSNGDWHVHNIGGSFHLVDVKVIFLRINNFKGIGLILVRKDITINNLITELLSDIIQQDTRTNNVKLSISEDIEFVTRFYSSNKPINIEDRDPEKVSDFNVHTFSFKCS